MRLTLAAAAAVLFSVAAGTPAAVSAQTVAAVPVAVVPSVMTARDSARAMGQMRIALRQLATKQEAHWAEHGSYTTDMAALGFFTVRRAADRATSTVAFPQVIFAGSRGWTAMSTYRGMTQSCVMFVGNADELPKLPVTRVDRRVAAEEGAPTCDAL